MLKILRILLFLRRKKCLKFFIILLFGLFFIVWMGIVLSNIYPTKVRRKVENLWLTKNYANLSDIIYVRNGKSLLEYKPEPFERHYFDAKISDMLPSNRSIPDTRHRSCKNKIYTFDAYKTTSVIIVFYNEARSTLLRTIISVINRTPSDLLMEIILIDDFSDDENDGKTLETINKIKLYRNKQREGLIRSRNIGANIAVGDYLMFLDSHCEVNIGWLEPLLARLSMHSGLAVSPIIDVIDSENFHYRPSSTKLKGGFDWSLHFKWIGINEEEIEIRKDETLPFTSPIVSGGIFIISRSWFFEIAGFNDDMEIWGGESIDLSIKSWLCGGQIEIVPCSRIGHVFRKKHPYNFPLGNSLTYLKNTKLIAESWLGEFKHFFYSQRPAAMDIQINETIIRSIERLQKNLQCRSFSWYLANVFNELKLPNEEHLAFGELKHGFLCLEVLKVSQGQKVTLSDCFEGKGTKWALHKKNGSLSTEAGACLSINEINNNIILEYCQQNLRQQWIRIGGTLKHVLSGKCLENLIGYDVGVSECRKGAPSQLWNFSVELQQLT